MILKIQIALTIVACLLVAAVFPVATWCSFAWGVIVALGAAVCFGGVMLCKRYTNTEQAQPQRDFLQEKNEISTQPQEKTEEKTLDKE